MWTVADHAVVYLYPPFHCFGSENAPKLLNVNVLFIFCLSFASNCNIINTVEPPAATTSRKRPPLLSDQFSKIPKVSESNHDIWNLL